MQIGSQVHTNDTSWEQLLNIARLMDDGPWHSIWVPDHFVPPLAFLAEDGDCLECWAVLTGLAAVTSRLRMGAIVTGNTYRNPALLAKMAATVDQIASGRLILGIGAAWHVREHEAYGWDYPSLKERMDRLEEAAELIRMLFTADGPVDFQGEYYRLVRAPFAPRGAQSPHIPIMVGGNGEKRTLRTLARHGDVMNLDECPVSLVGHKLDVLARHCDAIGRDPATIMKTALVPVGLQDDAAKAARLRELWGGRYADDAERQKNLAIGTAQHVIDVLGQYRDAGIDLVMFKGMPNNGGLYQRVVEEILPEFV